jgi:hypothetical protein
MMRDIRTDIIMFKFRHQHQSLNQQLQILSQQRRTIREETKILVEDPSFSEIISDIRKAREDLEIMKQLNQKLMQIISLNKSVIEDLRFSLEKEKGDDLKFPIEKDEEDDLKPFPISKDDLKLPDSWLYPNK